MKGVSDWIFFLINIADEEDCLIKEEEELPMASGCLSPSLTSKVLHGWDVG